MRSWTVFLRRPPIAMAKGGGSLRWCTTAPGGVTPQRGNFFRFYHLPTSPVLSVGGLQKSYHGLQKQVHPDKAHQRTEGEDQSQPTDTFFSTLSEDERHHLSVYANVAYETLKDPFLRCRYLSRLVRAQAAKEATHGQTATLTAEEEEQLANEDDTRSARIKESVPLRDMSEDFLMEVMSMNELIFAGDREDEQTRHRMIILKADLEERSAEYFERATDHWQKGQLDEFHFTVGEWTYLYNALRHLKDRL